MSNCCSKNVNTGQSQRSPVVTFNRAMPAVFSIFGMTCSSCEKTIEGVLSLVSGVESVDVDLGSNRALITGSFSVDDVINATGKAGYIAELIEARTSTKPSSEKANKSGYCCR